MQRRHFLASVLTLGLLATPSLAVPSADLEEVLENARKAAKHELWEKQPHGIAFEADARLQAIDCKLEMIFAPNGNFRIKTDGPLGRTAGWNGEAAWSRAHGGPTRMLALEERDSSLLAQWVHSGFWLNAKAPLERVLVEEGEAGVVVTIALPGSTTEARVTLDPSTWLPNEMRRGKGEREVVFSYSDYTPIAGIPLAHEVLRSEQGMSNRVRVTKGAPAPAGEHFAVPTGPPTDTRFLADVEGEIEIRRTRSGHLLVHPFIDGEQRGWFILDSGAGRFCIDPKVADDLGLAKFGEVGAMGIGGTVMTGFRSSKQLALGPIEIQNPVYVELDLSFLAPHFGVEVAGICGYDLFARCVLELDLEGPRAAIHDPAKYALERGEWSELVVEDRLPCVRCKFEGGREGLFKLDTGNPGSVAFHAPAVESLGLLEGRKVSNTMVGGVGGMKPAASGKLEWFEVGGKRFESVQATFAKADAGAFADTAVTGNLGSKLLSSFRVVFDYPGSRIAFAPLDE